MSAIAAVLGIGGAVALVLRLATRAHDGRGLEPYTNVLGIETAPVQALIGIAVSILVLGVAELLVRRRSTRTVHPPRRARGPLR